MKVIREARRRVAMWILPRPKPTMVEKLILAGDILQEDRRARILAGISGESLRELAWRALGSEAELELSGTVKDGIIEELCRRAFESRKSRVQSSPGRHANSAKATRYRRSA